MCVVGACVLMVRALNLLSTRLKAGEREKKNTRISTFLEHGFHSVSSRRRSSIRRLINSCRPAIRASRQQRPKFGLIASNALHRLRFAVQMAGAEQQFGHQHSAHVLLQSWFALLETGVGHQPIELMFVVGDFLDQRIEPIGFLRGIILGVMLWFQTRRRANIIYEVN